jgi:hypothetical protein
MYRAFAVILVVLLTACAGVTGVVSTDDNSYMLASHGTMGWSSSGAQKAKVFQDANEFCRSKGKQFEMINTRQVDGGFGKIASAEVEFRCM